MSMASVPLGQLADRVGERLGVGDVVLAVGEREHERLDADTAGLVRRFAFETALRRASAMATQ
jgi:hypothetical protein